MATFKLSMLHNAIIIDKITKTPVYTSWRRCMMWVIMVRAVVDLRSFLNKVNIDDDAGILGIKARKIATIAATYGHGNKGRCIIACKFRVSLMLCVYRFSSSLSLSLSSSSAAVAAVVKSSASTQTNVVGWL